MTIADNQYPVLELAYIQLIPLQQSHAEGLSESCLDGRLWLDRLTSTPHPDNTESYISQALQQQAGGERIAFVVVDKRNHRIIGSTSYYEFNRAVPRLSIGYTWYAKSYQRTATNTLCKFLLLQYAFEQLHVAAVGFRTDHLNVVSQRAIERLGAKQEGIIRKHALRRDGTLRDSVLYSITQEEWAKVKSHLQYLLNEKYLDERTRAH